MTINNVFEFIGTNFSAACAVGVLIFIWWALLELTWRVYKTTRGAFYWYEALEEYRDNHPEKFEKFQATRK